MVLASALLSSLHHDSHQSHSCGKENMGTWWRKKEGPVNTHDGRNTVGMSCVFNASSACVEEHKERLELWGEGGFP